MKMFLHAGSGKKTYREIPVSFEPPEWKEVRLDIDPTLEPDVVGSLTDMHDIPDNYFDAVFTSHTIEHLYAQEVYYALREMKRVLKPDGFALITCPDLEMVCRLIANGKLLHHLYDSPEGPVTPLDMLYGFRPQISRENTYMAHHTGFTKKVLCDSLVEIGFGAVLGKTRAKDFDLWALATKSSVSSELLTALSQRYFPE